MKEVVVGMVAESDKFAAKTGAAVETADCSDAIRFYLGSTLI